MQSKAKTVADYIDSLPSDRKKIIIEIRKTILKNLPKGFQEEMNYGMIGYVVPHKLYAEGYHCDPKMPLPFINVASQKSHIAVYHMGLYSSGTLLDWFQDEWKEYSSKKLNQGERLLVF